VDRLRTAIALNVAAIGLGACDPGVHIAWQKQFNKQVDPTCIASALKSVSFKVDRGTYISGGGRGFPKGTQVTQFGYSAGADRDYYNVDIAPVAGGKTNYWHGWSKIGTSIPPDERARILPPLYRANRAVAAACGLSFDDVIPEQGDG